MELASQNTPVPTQETVGKSWNSQAWDEIFEEVEEEEHDEISDGN